VFLRAANLVMFVLCTASAMAAQAPDLATIVQRMTFAHQQNRSRMHAYVLTRAYHVFQKGEQKSEFVATISYVPPQEKSFAISESSGGMAERVVRKALEKEVELAKNPETIELGPSNYSFVLVGSQPIDGRLCYVLDMTPLRASKDLLKGRLWVDQQSYLVRRVEGEPSKSPSWWIKSLRLVLTYGEHDGMWMQTASEADAHIRMAGDYKLISRDLQLRRQTVVAERQRNTINLAPLATYVRR